MYMSDLHTCTCLNDCTCNDMYNIICLPLEAMGRVILRPMQCSCTGLMCTALLLESTRSPEQRKGMEHLNVHVITVVNENYS